MLRELVEALEVVTSEHPLILVLEDLHWSDVSTLDLLSMVARRREAARLLVVGTYRPVEMLVNGHPLRAVTQELLAPHLGTELPLPLLTEAEITAYLQTCFPHSLLPTQLPHVLFRRTEGNPLFLVNVVDDLVARRVVVQDAQGWIWQDGVKDVEANVPESVRQLITRQREQLSAEQQHVLAAASVAGMEFSAAAVAAALTQDVVGVEEQCTGLADRQQFLRRAGISEWPDGTVAARYGFEHALYQQLWHERVDVSQLQRWHLRIGERKEAAYGEQVAEIATELAIHFEQGHDYVRAVQYLQQAGETAVRRLAYHEAIKHFTKSLAVLKTLPSTPVRAQQELTLQIALSTPLIALKGYTALEVEQVCSRARELCRQLGEMPHLFPVLGGLCSVYCNREELRTALELAEQMLRLAKSSQAPLRLLWAHYALGFILSQQGEQVSARAHLEQSLTFYSRQENRSYGFVQDPGVTGLSRLAHILRSLGYPDQALVRSQEALALARELIHPYSLAYALDTAAEIYRARGEQEAARELEEEGIILSGEQGFPYWLARGTIKQGWDLVEQRQVEKGIERMHEGWTALQAVGAEGGKPSFLAMLAAAYAQVGQVEDGLSTLREALAFVDKTGERVDEAELYRVKGELTLQKLSVVSSQLLVTDPRPLTPDPQGEAEVCFLKAIDIARKQQAKSLELRAVISLVRLRQQQAIQRASRNTQHEARARLAEAHNMLSEIYNWFTEGFETKDLQEAKALLKELKH